MSRSDEQGLRPGVRGDAKLVEDKDGADCADEIIERSQGRPLEQVLRDRGTKLCQSDLSGLSAVIVSCVEAVFLTCGGLKGLFLRSSYSAESRRMLAMDTDIAGRQQFVGW